MAHSCKNGSQISQKICAKTKTKFCSILPLFDICTLCQIPFCCAFDLFCCNNASWGIFFCQTSSSYLLNTMVGESGSQCFEINYEGSILIHNLKCVCSYISHDIRPDQLEHMLLRVPISFIHMYFCYKNTMKQLGSLADSLGSDPFALSLTIIVSCFQ